MKNRLIVAAIGIPALLAVIFFTPIWGWGIVVAVMASFCAWELLHTAMPKFVPRFAVYAGVCGAAIVLGAAFGLSELVSQSRARSVSGSGARVHGGHRHPVDALVARAPWFE